jgi:hypothetical protein
MGFNHASQNGKELLEMMDENWDRDDPSPHPRDTRLRTDPNWMMFTENNGKYAIDGIELPADRPEEWGSIMIAEIAKRYLK